jgi:TetR/AcrR family transcriptional repressor of nem operon
MTTASNTKEKIVELGRDFVQEIGYHAFKYQLIAQQLNIKNAAIHHYFPNKEDLGIAIIEKDIEDFKFIEKTFNNSTATEKAEGLLQYYQASFAAGKNLCIVGACMSAYKDIPERMQVASKNYQEYILSWLTNVFKQGVKSGEFKLTTTPEDQAALWIATLPGALQVAQIRGEAYMNQVLNALRLIWRKH